MVVIPEDGHYFLKETARSQEWLVLRVTNTLCPIGYSLQKIVDRPKLVGSSF